MKRFISSIVAGLAVAASALLPLTTSAADFNWRLVVGYPRDIALGKLYPDFARNIEQMSDGRIKVEIVYDGEGVNQSEIYGAIKSGIVEMGFPYMALFTGDFPAGMVQLGLPGGPSDYLQLRALFETTEWADVLRDAYAKQGLYLLGEEYSLPTYLVTKDPVDSLDVLKGKKIRAPGAYGKMFRELGATPVNIAYSEVYIALTTGTVWGVDAMNIVDHEGGKFHEIAKHLYPMPVTGSQVFPILVNMDAWNELPEDLQAILHAAADRHTSHVAVQLLEMETESLNAMKEGGLRVGPQPSQEARQEWLAAGQRIWEDYESGETSKKLLDIQKAFMESHSK